MAITRVAFNDSASYSGAYSLPVNPAELDLNYSDDASFFTTLDGSPVKQSAYFDDRPITMSWFRVTTDVSNFGTMVTTLRGYRNQIKYVNFGSADYATPTLSWLKTRVANVEVKIERGGIIRKNLTVTLYLEPA